MSNVFTKVTEVYDLHTQKGKIGVIGIKTPSGRVINNSYRGLLMNYRKVKFLSCDVAMACASSLPIDPLQVGFEAGQQVDPRDAFEPMLYSAVSNDSMGNIVSRIYPATGGSPSAPLNGDSVSYQADATTVNSGDATTTYDAFTVYHRLLATGDFRKAMPQQGLAMSGLKPFVYPMATTRKFNANGYGVSGSDVTNPPTNITDGAGGTTLGAFSVFSTHPVPMPSVETVNWLSGSPDGSSHLIGSPDPTSFVPNQNSVVGDIPDNCKVPPCYVACIITPPARDTVFYYRMTVTWNIVFSGLRSLTEIQTMTSLAYPHFGDYYTDYDTASSSMTANMSSVDTLDEPVELVMTKVI